MEELKRLSQGGVGRYNASVSVNTVYKWYEHHSKAKNVSRISMPSDEKTLARHGRTIAPYWTPEKRDTTGRGEAGLSPAGSEHDRRSSALDEVSTRIARMRGGDDVPRRRGWHHRWFRYRAI